MNEYGNANYLVRSRNTISETIKLVVTCRFKTCQYAIYQVSINTDNTTEYCLTKNRKM